jgi:hypothetical protein
MKCEVRTLHTTLQALPDLPPLISAWAEIFATPVRGSKWTLVHGDW